MVIPFVNSFCVNEVRRRARKTVRFCFDGFELTSVREKAYNRTMKKCKESEFSYEN